MKIYKLIGLMSGTSLDGLDMAYCHIWNENGFWKFSIQKTRSIPYTSEMHEQLKNSIHLTAEALLVLHNKYGTWLGQMVKDFTTDFGLDVEMIASHGHTSHHRPELGFTFQLGSGQHLANACGYPVICDFRTNDVALGGQGAPLVPIGDRLFFGTYDFCLNLGGISNVSFEKDGNRMAYDVGLANMPLNHITQKIGLSYDAEGALARSGTLHASLLQKLNSLEYYHLPYPKSTGFEWFTEMVMPLLDATEDSMENVLHTVIHHNCEQIMLQLNKNGPYESRTLFVTGGGALNTFFVEVLQEKLGSNTEVIVPSKELIEFKEALVFALMGALRMENQVNVLRSVTGARRDSSSGVFYHPS